MAKGILQTERESWLSGRTDNLEEHHIFYGQGRRKLSERYGLKVWLTHDEHNEPPHGVHFNQELRRALERAGQTAFERRYPELDFVGIFGRNCL
jgi:hypothetical protein